METLKLSIHTIDLSGDWHFRLDRSDLGIAQCWWKSPFSERRIHLPGSLQAEGFGDDVSLETQWVGLVRGGEWHSDPTYAPYQPSDAIKFPFWLQPRKHYVGVVWYQRRIHIPDDWEGKRVIARFERAHWGTRLWLDDVEIGANDSLSVPHEYALTTRAVPGNYTLTVRVDNRMLIEVGRNAHSISDHTQTNWNGLVGSLSLVATDSVYFDDIQVYPDVAGRKARVRLCIGNVSGIQVKSLLRLRAEGFNNPRPHELDATSVDLEIPVEGLQTELVYELGPGAQLWDEFHPALYRLTASLSGWTGETCFNAKTTTVFGLREFLAQGTQFAINGRKTFLRGTLECAVFPLTGYPPTDVASWRRILKTVKAHGLNHIRFHSWCPPEAAFVAGDELGVYFQVECGVWTTVGEGTNVDDWLYREAQRILKTYGNHPCFVMMAHGNEPYGECAPYLAQWVKHWQSEDPRRLYTSGAGWPVISESDFHSTPAPRSHQWGDGLNSRLNAQPPATTADYRDWVTKRQAPIVSHEIGQWCAYPNFAEIDKCTGLLQAKNFEVFRDSLAAHHMEDQAFDFLMASGKLQTLCYKEEIESALRTEGFGGFQLLGLHDFPGQGTALVGVLDAFWESKGYVTPAEYRRFCNSTVLLARLEKRIFTDQEPFRAAIEIAHFGNEPLARTKVVWRLLDDDGKALRQGEIAADYVPIGNGARLGEIAFTWDGIPTACRYRLEAHLDTYPYGNDWDVWLFPSDVSTEGSEGIHIAAALDDDVRVRLQSGGKVLLLADRAATAVDVQVGFSPVFWNTVWTDGQAPHTLGILCNPSHPALSSFPTDFHTNWQWWELLHGARALVIDDLPFTLRPIVQPIDTWFRNHRLGLVFEAIIDRGSLLVCSMDIHRDLSERPVARQLRRSLLDYMQSNDFRPEVRVDWSTLTRVIGHAHARSQ